MSTRRRISIRKVIQTLVTILLVAGCTVAILSADRLQNHKKIKGITINIRNSNKVHFLDEAQVKKMLFTDRNINPESVTLAELDLHKMEAIARNNPWVSSAQVYVDNEQQLALNITQRIPVARLFETNGTSYYLDSALHPMPLSTTYVHYVPIVTGAPQLREDSTGMATKGTILSLVNFITRHPFWNAQIAQIEVVEDLKFELIPILGKQRILLGDTSRLEQKLDNLFAFYQQVCNKVGWDKYHTIDLRYEGQVVASPALAWKAPVDRALSNMNWVKAILAAGDKGEKDESAIPASAAIATKPPITAATKNATPPVKTAKTTSPPVPKEHQSTAQSSLSAELPDKKEKKKEDQKKPDQKEKKPLTDPKKNILKKEKKKTP